MSHNVTILLSNMEFKGFDRFTSRLKGKDSDLFLPQAKEQILLFAASPIQESIATFQSAKGVVFDLRQQASGTVLRVERGEKTILYDWFVVGEKQAQDGRYKLYHVIHTDDDEDLVVGTRPNLELRSTWGLRPSTSQEEFPILEAGVHLFGTRNMLSVNKIDVMMGGIKQKQSLKTQATNSIQLKPATH